VAEVVDELLLVEMRPVLVFFLDGIIVLDEDGVFRRFGVCAFGIGRYDRRQQGEQTHPQNGVSAIDLLGFLRLHHILGDGGIAVADV
jgi:hypothetical protein